MRLTFRNFTSACQNKTDMQETFHLLLENENATFLILTVFLPRHCINKWWKKTFETKKREQADFRKKFSDTWITVEYSSVKNRSVNYRFPIWNVSIKLGRTLTLIRLTLLFPDILHYSLPLSSLFFFFPFCSLFPRFG